MENSTYMDEKCLRFAAFLLLRQSSDKRKGETGIDGTDCVDDQVYYSN